MTFHGKPRASHEVMHHVHESPMVMLVPLFILSIGALLAGALSRAISSATNMRSSGRVRCSRCRKTSSWKSSITCLRW